MEVTNMSRRERIDAFQTSVNEVMDNTATAKIDSVLLDNLRRTASALTRDEFNWILSLYHAMYVMKGNESFPYIDNMENAIYECLDLSENENADTYLLSMFENLLMRIKDETTGSVIDSELHYKLTQLAASIAPEEYQQLVKLYHEMICNKGKEGFLYFDELEGNIFSCLDLTALEQRFYQVF